MTLNRLFCQCFLFGLLSVFSLHACFLFCCVSLLSVCITPSSTSIVSLVRFSSAVFLPVSNHSRHPVYLSPRFLLVPCLIIVGSACVSSAVQSFSLVQSVMFCSFCLHNKHRPHPQSACESCIWVPSSLCPHIDVTWSC